VFGKYFYPDTSRQWEMSWLAGIQVTKMVWFGLPNMLALQIYTKTPEA
jgi:hypothetical protein